jgi:hypothetical protein
VQATNCARWLLASPEESSDCYEDWEDSCDGSSSHSESNSSLVTTSSRSDTDDQSDGSGDPSVPTPRTHKSIKWAKDPIANLKIRRCLEKCEAEHRKILYSDILLDDVEFWSQYDNIKADTLGRHLRDVKCGKKRDKTGVLEPGDLDRWFATTLQGKRKR